MMRLRRPEAIASFLATVALSALSAPAAPAPAAADEPAAALVLFVAFPTNLYDLPDPTALRHRASRVLATALAAPGGAVVTAPEIEPTMRAWRVRSERDVGPGFLGALGAAHGAREVVLATLAVYRDRVLLVARGLSPNSGRLGWVHSVEERRDERAADPALDLDAVVAAAARRLAEGCTPRGLLENAEDLVVLPPRPVGLDRGPADLAMHCLLRSLLTTGRWSLPDPTAVVSALQDGGHDPHLLDAAARRALAERFGARRLVVPRLVAFPPGAPPPAVAALARDDEFGASAAGAVPETSVLLALVAIDAGTGRILGGETTYLAARNPAGMFGIARRDPLDARIQVETDRLVHALLDGGRDAE